MSVRTKFLDDRLCGRMSSIGDVNSSVGISTARTPKAVVTTNIQASSRTIHSVDT